MKAAIALSLALALVACGQEERLPDTAPFAHEDFARTGPRTAVDIDVLANDIDIDGGTLTIELVTVPPTAAASVIAGNRVRVTPVAGFIGRIEMMYAVRDAQGSVSPPARIVVDVAPQARALVSTSDGDATRWYLADTAASKLLLTATTGLPAQYAFSKDAGVLALIHCAAEAQCTVLSVRTRTITLGEPKILLADAPLEPMLAISADGQRIVLVRRTEDSASTRGWTDELISLDSATGEILQKVMLTPDKDIGAIIAGGDARKIFVTGRLPSAPSTMWVADFDGQTVTRVAVPWPFSSFDYCGPCAPPFPRGNVPVSDDGRFMAFISTNSFMFMVDAENPRMFITLSPLDHIRFPSTDAVRSPLAFVPGTTDLVFAKYPFSSSCCTPPQPPQPAPRTLWRMPLTAPSAAWNISGPTMGAPLNRLVAIRADGMRLTDSSSMPDAGFSRLSEIDTTNGASFGDLSPPTGIESLLEFRYVGESADLFVLAGDAQAGKTLCLIRRATPGVLESFAGDRVYSDIVNVDADAAATTAGFTLVEGSSDAPIVRAYLSDVDTPAVSVPLAVPEAPYEKLERVIGAEIY